MTVEVTQDAAGVLKTKVTYSAAGGETSKADDQEFQQLCSTSSINEIRLH